MTRQSRNTFPPLESNGTVVLFDMRLSKGDFDIELVFLDDFTESQKRVLQYTAPALDGSHYRGCAGV